MKKVMGKISDTLYGDYIKELSGGMVVENEHGFIIYRVNSQECFIVDMYVRPESRRSGNGLSLIKDLESSAVNHGCSRITAGIYLESNKSSSIVAAALAGGFLIHGANGGIVQIYKPVMNQGGSSGSVA